jgi:hypothetical protein
VPEPLFDFFERIAQELSGRGSSVITHEDFREDEDLSPLLEALIKCLKAASVEDTIQCAVEQLKEHFEVKGAKLPFDYRSETGMFTATDPEFLSFVSETKDMRSIGKRSKDFECSVAKRLALRATGTLHRVGHPRDREKKKPEFNRYLRKLGFDRPVLLGKEKDGGFDILWMLPLGTIPHQPIVSIQCKNGEFNMAEADKSVAAAKRSFGQNHRLQPSVHVPCVLFNDYLYPKRITEKAVEFVPLGLTDLASLSKLTTLDLI